MKIAVEIEIDKIHVIGTLADFLRDTGEVLQTTEVVIDEIRHLLQHKSKDYIEEVAKTLDGETVVKLIKQAEKLFPSLK